MPDKYTSSQKIAYKSLLFQHWGRGASPPYPSSSFAPAFIVRYFTESIKAFHILFHHSLLSKKQYFLAENAIMRNGLKNATPSKCKFDQENILICFQAIITTFININKATAAAPFKNYNIKLIWICWRYQYPIQYFKKQCIF